jgi:hypothetical protein
VTVAVAVLVTADCDYLRQVAVDYASIKPLLVSMGLTSDTFLRHQEFRILILKFYCMSEAVDRLQNELPTRSFL